jgi:uncharacterized protein YbjT (DUF2867 family)
MRILIAGASGYLGRHVSEEAKKAGFTVRVLLRKESQAASFSSLADEIIVGQATKSADLKGIAENCDIVFSSLGITRQKDGLTYEQVDYQANANLLAEAERSKCTLFCYVSVFKGRNLRWVKLVEAKERFVDLLSQSTIPSAVIRPTGFFSDMADFFNMAQAGRVYLFGKGTGRFNPISGKDLAVEIIRSCKAQIDRGERASELKIGGPDTLSMNQIALLALKASGKQEKIVHLPDVLRRITLAVLPRITPLSVYGPLQFFLAAMGISDLAAPEYGSDHLSDFYRQLAEGTNEEP